MTTYKDKVSGETLYVDRLRDVLFYFKDENGTIFHRVDGPAKEYSDGDTVWMQNSKRHRMDGPAVDWYGMKEWWVNGIRLTYARGDYYDGPYSLQSKLDDLKGKL